VSTEGQPKRTINPYRAFVGSWVPNWLMERTEISPGAKLTYGRLAQHAGRDGDCRPRQDTLARELGVGPRQIRRYLDELEVSGLVGEMRMGQGQANRYVFFEHLWITATDTLPLDWSHPSSEPLDRTDPSSQPPFEWTHLSGPDRTHLSGPYKEEENPRREKTSRAHARPPKTNGDTRPSPPGGPVPTVRPDSTRCRHRNDPGSCGACSNPTVAPPPANLRQLAAGGGT
jgi:hypothetical protein